MLEVTPRVRPRGATAGRTRRCQEAFAPPPAAALDLVLADQVERGDVTLRRRTSASCASRRVLVEPLRRDVGESLPSAALTSCSPVGKRARSTRSSDGSKPLEPVRGEVRLVERRDRNAAAGREHAPRLRERGGRSTRWSTSQSTARSNQPSLNGSDSACACLNAPGTFSFATSSMACAASTPQTFACARSTSATLNDPCSRRPGCGGRAGPQGARAARRPPTSAASTGEPRRSVPQAAEADARARLGFHRLGHRLDGVLREVDRPLRHEHRERVRVFLRLKLRLDPGLGEDRLDLLRLGDVACDRFTCTMLVIWSPRRS